MKLKRLAVGLLLFSALAGSAIAQSPVVARYGGIPIDDDRTTRVTNLSQLQLGVPGSGTAGIGDVVFQSEKGTTSVITVDYSAVQLGESIRAEIVEGPEHFKILSDNCVGKKLEAFTSTTDKSGCDLKIQAVASDNGEHAGVLRLRHPNGDFNVPLTLSVTGMVKASISLERDATCAADRRTEIDCAVITLENKGQFAAKDITPGATGEHAEKFSFAHNCGARLLPGGSCHMTVRAVGLTDNGTFAAHMNVKYQSEGTGDWTGTDLFTNAKLATVRVTGWVPKLEFMESSGANMDVAGPPETVGGEAYGDIRTFTVKNTGETKSAPISTLTSNPTNFEIFGDDCTGIELARDATCLIRVRPKAAVNGVLSGYLRVTQGTKNTDIALSGTATKLTPAKLVVEATNGDPFGFVVTGPAQPSYSAPVTFILTNQGEMASSNVNWTLANALNFEQAGGTCQNGASILAPGQSCSLIIRAKASEDRTFTSSLVIKTDATITMTLSGVASGFRTYSWITADWGICTAANVCSGSGTSQRTVTCQRDDGETVADAFCGGTKPASSQSCTSPAGNRACSIANGTGTQSCAVGSKTWGSCELLACNTGYTNTSGVCVSAYTYAWDTGAFGSCSAANVCTGTGTRTRTVTCRRSDGSAMADSYCAGTKPTTTEACSSPAGSRACNILNGAGTQSCAAASTSWGACTAASCSTGYKISNNACVEDGTKLSCTTAGGRDGGASVTVNSGTKPLTAQECKTVCEGPYLPNGDGTYKNLKEQQTLFYTTKWTTIPTAWGWFSTTQCRCLWGNHYADPNFPAGGICN